MKKFHLSGLSLPVMALTVLCFHPSNLSAAAPSYTPQEQQRSVGSKVGGFFKGLFYGRSSSGRYMGETSVNSNTGSSGYSLDRPPQETANSPKTTPIDPVAPSPLPPQEDKSVPKEISHITAPESRVPAIKPAAKKTDAPPVTIKPATDEVLPAESSKPAAITSTKPVPKTVPNVQVASNKPVPDNKPAIEQKIDPPAPTASSGGLPVGSRTDKPGRVKSPYPPYNELDVSGLQSGSLAMDPTTQKVFRLP